MRQRFAETKDPRGNYCSSIGAYLIGKTVAQARLIVAECPTKRLVLGIVHSRSGCAACSLWYAPKQGQDIEHETICCIPYEYGAEVAAIVYSPVRGRDGFKLSTGPRGLRVTRFIDRPIRPTAKPRRKVAPTKKDPTKEVAKKARRRLTA